MKEEGKTEFFNVHQFQITLFKGFTINTHIYKNKKRSLLFVVVKIGLFDKSIKIISFYDSIFWFFKQRGSDFKTISNDFKDITARKQGRRFKRFFIN